MKVQLKKYICIIEREESDKKIYKDSTLFTHIKRELQKQGYDVISKDLSKERGNLLSNGAYGIIARDRSWQMMYSNYCVEPAYKKYNGEEGVLIIVGVGEVQLINVKDGV
jgi:hypothetical protein